MWNCLWTQLKWDTGIFSRIRVVQWLNLNISTYANTDKCEKKNPTEVESPTVSGHRTKAKGFSRDFASRRNRFTSSMEHHFWKVIFADARRTTIEVLYDPETRQSMDKFSQGRKKICPRRVFHGRWEGWKGRNGLATVRSRKTTVELSLFNVCFVTEPAEVWAFDEDFRRVIYHSPVSLLGTGDAICSQLVRIDRNRINGSFVRRKERGTPLHLAK